MHQPGKPRERCPRWRIVLILCLVLECNIVRLYYRTEAPVTDLRMGTLVKGLGPREMHRSVSKWNSGLFPCCQMIANGHTSRASDKAEWQLRQNAVIHEFDRGVTKRMSAFLV